MDHIPHEHMDHIPHRPYSIWTIFHMYHIPHGPYFTKSTWALFHKDHIPHGPYCEAKKLYYSHSYHKTGDTAVIRCEITSDLLTGAPGWKIYWRHGGKEYTYLGSKGNVHMYDNGIVGESRSNFLVLQYRHMLSF
jgi:hypothetical protein